MSDKERQLPFVVTGPLRVQYDALGNESGQCGIAYPGAAGRCQNDAAFKTTIDTGGEYVPICEKHFRKHAACFCEGESPDWKYHSPDGCGKTAQGFALAGGRRD